MKQATHYSKIFLSVCAGPILLALAAAATTSDEMHPAPTPTTTTTEAPLEIYPESIMSSDYSDSTSTTTDSYSDPTPAPYIEETTQPTDIYIETTDGGEEEVMTVPDGPGEEGGEEGEPMMAMASSSGGGACYTYDEDEHAAALLPEVCEYNTYMCCWTGYDGDAEMYGNTDVCRVLDYPEEGDVLEMPRDEEGSVYCHGFAWEDGAEVKTFILPLYHYVTNFERTEEGGYYGNVEGSPECGCIEEMPVVSQAGCSWLGRTGIADCPQDLGRHYKNRLQAPRGDMESNLLRACDNEDVPDYDFRTCEHNTYMCCWTENDGKGMADNTDVCRVIDYPEVGQTTEYPGESEGEVHCHGFVWPEDATDKYIHLLAQFVQHFDHRDRRGYYGNIPGAPMCGCVEEMPIVSEADCTTYDDAVGREGKFKSCTKNDLRTRFLEEYPMGELPNLVEECDNEDA